jgi:hypothetical protein
MSPRLRFCRARPLLIAMLFVAVLAVSPLSAGRAAAETSNNPLRPHVWALEFEVQPRLSGFYGAAGIAAKYHFTERAAVRWGALVYIDHDESEGTRHVVQQVLSQYLDQTVPTRDAYDRRDVSLFAHYVRYLRAGRRFGTYVEVGPTVRWSSSESSSMASYPGPDGPSEASRASDRNVWSVGGDLAAGFEWFFMRRLSLAGRYGVAVLATDSDETTSQDFRDGSGDFEHVFETTHGSGYFIQTTPAVLSLTAYW